ncbi:MAG: metallophosphoesterase [Eubacteriales bacterium]|nr:metallophosphoesterase [Eubacteriales bacterium]
MRIFIIADTHLSEQADKSMEVFGCRWENYTQRLRTNWQREVAEEDTVLVAGDISWAMKLEQAEKDLRFFHELPGQKIFLRGNHDYWWSTLSKVENFCREKEFDSLRFMQNKAFPIGEDFLVAGSRLWILPDDSRFAQADRKILAREEKRLALSLEDAKAQKAGRSLLVMTHYPPFEKDLKPNPLTVRIREAGAVEAFYGHIHRADSPYCLERVEVDGVPYSLVAADHIDFCPRLIAEGK